jgi:pimeloyl-ACP methyl ester carboxylesterase
MNEVATHTESRRVTSRDGTTIAFDRVGTGEPLILVDAAGGYRGFGPMGALAAALSAEFTVVSYDRRGRGDSGDLQPYAVDREVEDLEALLDEVGGAAYVHGYSSGALLALHAAIRGLPIRKLALLEPPLDLDPQAVPDTQLEQEIAGLVAEGRRGDAVEHFNRSIGVPEEYLEGMRDAPWWPGMEALAHTLVYDLIVSRTLTTATLASVTVPTLIIASQASDERLAGWSRALAEALPNASLQTLPGEWHGVAPEVLGPAMAAFFRGEPAQKVESRGRDTSKG